MTTATAAIANHLNIAEAIIASVEEWAHVLFVRFIGRRPRFVSQKVVKMSIAEKIQNLSRPSAEENALGDLVAKTPKSQRPPLNRKYSALRQERENSLKAAMNQAWMALKGLGYERFSYSGNAALESGHSDYSDEDANYRFHGVVAPDGKQFNAEGAYWHEAIPAAAEYAGI